MSLAQFYWSAYLKLWRPRSERSDDARCCRPSRCECSLSRDLWDFECRSRKNHAFSST